MQIIQINIFILYTVGFLKYLKNIYFYSWYLKIPKPVVSPFQWFQWEKWPQILRVLILVTNWIPVSLAS